LIKSDKSSGIYNLVSPEPTTNELFTSILSGQLHRPAFFVVPEFALKLVYGEAAEMLTTGARVTPAHLLDEGFQFQFPDISSAIADLVKKS
jgi:NAD dependent epimerase/dehydratase family enzyme